MGGRPVTCSGDELNFYMLFDTLHVMLLLICKHERVDLL